MDRKKAIKNLLLLMEDFGRLMITKKIKLTPSSIISNSQMDALLIIHFYGHQSVKGLAEKLHVTSSGVSQLVNFLVKDGLLMRIEDESDRRIIRLELTKKADHLLEEEKKIRMKHGRSLFAGLNDDELKQLCKLQMKMNEYLHLSDGKK
jgi:MarR family transcriptional regulator, organic hydroperoxide resistance regulator